MQDRYLDWLDQQTFHSDDEIIQRMGGYADAIQDELMEEHCDALRSGQDPEVEMQQPLNELRGFLGGMFGAPAEPEWANPLLAADVQAKLVPLQDQVQAIYASPRWQQALKANQQKELKKMVAEIEPLNLQIAEIIEQAFSAAGSTEQPLPNIPDPANTAARYQQLKQDWLLLLQLDSDAMLDWSWGDSGRLYFWIHREDLAARRFEQVYMQLQCY